eukprot:gene24353-9968_t
MYRDDAESVKATLSMVRSSESTATLSIVRSSGSTLKQAQPSPPGGGLSASTLPWLQYFASTVCRWIPWVYIPVHGLAFKLLYMSDVQHVQCPMMSFSDFIEHYNIRRPRRSDSTRPAGPCTTTRDSTGDPGQRPKPRRVDLLKINVGALA